MSEENQGAVVIELFPYRWEFRDDEHQFIVDGEVVGRIHSSEDHWYWQLMCCGSWMCGCDYERDRAMRTLEEGWRELRRREKARRDVDTSA